MKKGEKPRLVKIGLLQTRALPKPEDNLKKTLQLAEQAVKKGAQIICTQELFTSYYFCQEENHDYFKLAEPIPGPTTKAFQKFAKSTTSSSSLRIFEKRAAGLYHNTAAVIDADGSLLGIYRKMHIPDDPLFYEKFYFTPGDLGFKAFKTKYANIGTLVCWDQWYPEAARLTAMQGRGNSLLSHRHRLASQREKGIRQSKPLARGKSSSALTPSPTAATSPASIASVTKRPAAGTASSSGAKASSRTLPANCSPKVASTRKKCSWSKST